MELVGSAEASNSVRCVLAEVNRVRMSISESIVLCTGRTLRNTITASSTRCTGAACSKHLKISKSELGETKRFYRWAAPLVVYGAHCDFFATYSVTLSS